MIAVLGKYRDYERLCQHCNLNPKKNLVFQFIGRDSDAMGVLFSDFVVAGDTDKLNQSDQILLNLVLTRIRNDNQQAIPG